MTEEMDKHEEEHDLNTKQTDSESDEISIFERTSDEPTEDVNASRSLREALEKYKIELPVKTVERLNEYCDILWTWNERLNLTRHTTYDKFVARDLVDSIRLASLLQRGEHVLDVGSGGGAPGLIFSLLRPDVAVELCESTGKKATALGDMADQLDLDLNVWYAKAEDLLKERKFHTLTVRAVGKMRSLLTIFAPVWNRFNRLLLIKGPNWPSERGEARHYNLLNKLALRKLDEYEIPDAGYNSVILQICRKDRFEEMERRAKELHNGEPYDGEIEELVIESKSNAQRIRNEVRNIESSSQKRESNETESRSRRRQSDRAQNAARGGAQVFARRDGKPPKGWTGKKKEFRQENLPEGVKLRRDFRETKSDKTHDSNRSRQSRDFQGQNKHDRRAER